MRSIVLDDPAHLARPAVRALIARAIEAAKAPLPTTPGRTVVRAVSAKQRPRRPTK